MMDSDQDFIELSTSEDSESEEEKEKEDKDRIITFKFNYIKMLLSLKRSSCKKIISLHHPDISTPPPKLYSNLA